MVTFLLVLAVGYIAWVGRDVVARLKALEAPTPPEKSARRIAEDAVADHVRTYHKGR